MHTTNQRATDLRSSCLPLNTLSTRTHTNHTLSEASCSLSLVLIQSMRSTVFLSLIYRLLHENVFKTSIFSLKESSLFPSFPSWYFEYVNSFWLLPSEHQILCYKTDSPLKECSMFYTCHEWSSDSYSDSLPDPLYLDAITATVPWLSHSHQLQKTLPRNTAPLAISSPLTHCRMPLISRADLVRASDRNHLRTTRRTALFV